MFLSCFWRENSNILLILKKCYKSFYETSIKIVNVRNKRTFKNRNGQWKSISSSSSMNWIKISFQSETLHTSASHRSMHHEGVKISFIHFTYFSSHSLTMSIEKWSYTLTQGYKICAQNQIKSKNLRLVWIFTPKYRKFWKTRLKVSINKRDILTNWTKLQISSYESSK